MFKIVKFFIIAVFALLIQEIEPRSLILGDTITLYCPVQTNGKDLSVKSVTWLKDGVEFYKYNTEQGFLRPVLMYQMKGVQLKENSATDGTKLVMGPVTLETAGEYKCVVELFNPHFKGLKLTLNVNTELGFIRH